MEHTNRLTTDRALFLCVKEARDDEAALYLKDEVVSEKDVLTRLAKGYICMKQKNHYTKRSHISQTYTRDHLLRWFVPIFIKKKVELRKKYGALPKSKQESIPLDMACDFIDFQCVKCIYSVVMVYLFGGRYLENGVEVDDYYVLGRIQSATSWDIFKDLYGK